LKKTTCERNIGSFVKDEPNVGIHCSVLVEDAIRAAITDWRECKGDDVASGEQPPKSKEE
jgi:NifU-like protein involved in Fe-S cluster formation